MARVPALNFYRRYRATSLAVLLLASGCGGGDDSPPPGGTPPGSSGAVQVRGTERIAWAQQIESGNANGYQFFALVDDAAMALTGIQCTSSTSNADCSAPLPRMSSGPHKFQLVAVNAQGVQSSPSDALILNVTAAQTAPATSEDSDSSQCPSCGTLDVIARGLGRIDRLLALPEGDLLILHEGQQVLRLRDGALTEAARIDQRREPSTRWIDVDVHPDFPDVPFVFVLTLRDDGSGTRTTSIIRLRAVADILTEQVTVVPEIALNSITQPELSVGADKLLYLAMPRVDEGAQRSPYGGLLLRFALDGSAAGNATGTSPVLASGAARPGPMAWDVAKQLWLAENEPGVPASGLQSMAPEKPSDAWPRVFTRRIASALVKGDHVGGLAFTSHKESPAAYVIAGIPGVLYRVLFRSMEDMSVIESRAVLGGSIALTAVERGATGALFVAGTDGSAGSIVAKVTDPSTLLPLSGH